MRKGCNVSVKPKFPGESTEALIRRFKKKCEKANLMGDLRKQECYVPKSEKKRVKHKKAVQRLRKDATRRAARFGYDK